MDLLSAAFDSASSTWWIDTWDSSTPAPSTSYIFIVGTFDFGLEPGQLSYVSQMG